MPVKIALRVLAIIAHLATYDVLPIANTAVVLSKFNTLYIYS